MVWRLGDVVRVDPVVQQLHDASKAGCVADLQGALNAGVDVNARDYLHVTALHWATRYRQSVEVVELLPKHGADPNSQDGLGRTPVTEAASNASSFYVEEPDIRPLASLLNAGGKIRLAEAVILGDLDLIRQRCQEGEDPSAWHDTSGWDSHLSLAAGHGDVAVVATLLDLGANIEVHDDLGSVALMKAAGSHYRRPGPLQTIRLLLDRGANINAKDWTDQTALFLAADQGNRDIVDELLRRGAKRTILDAIVFGDLELVDRLFYKTECGVDRRPGIEPYLIIAAKHGQVEVVRYLLDWGENVDGKDAQNPLKVALERGHLPVAALLRARGAREPFAGSGTG